jgi:hypothetical protein
MRVWLKSLFALVSAVVAAGSIVHAQADAPRLTVVELFTSQGCSSCPPADAALKSLRDRPGILTLSWPVDYWDRLGWEDTFAQPHNAVRQAAYNKRLGRGGVFTPQMIIDGRFQCVGSKPEKVRGSIEKARDVNRPVYQPELKRRADGNFDLMLPKTPMDGMIAVRIAWYLADASVQIGDGENQGRTLHYTNVVRASHMLEDWKGGAMTVTLEAEEGLNAGADHVAILLQDDYGHGPIVGATSAPIRATAEGR